MISKEQYFGLKQGDLIQDNDGVGRWHVLYTEPTSHPDEKRVIVESPMEVIHDTTLIGEKIYDTDLRTEVSGLNGENVKLLPEKDAMLT